MSAKKFGAFVLGGVVGAGIALLCAPRSGEETRAAMACRANQAWNDAQDLGAMGQDLYEDAAARGAEIYEEAINDAQETINDAQSVINNAQQTASVQAAETSEELREKIMEARNRIGEQIARNAENDISEQEIPEVKETPEVETCAEQPQHASQETKEL